MNRLLRRLTAATCTLLPSALLAAPPAAAAAPVKISVNGTVCWELVPKPDCFVEVSLSSPAPANMTVDMDTQDGSATAPEDYAAVSSLVVQVPAGATSVLVPMSIVADKFGEDDEFFTVIISNPSDGEIIDDRDTVTIHDGAP
jgi:hypothetical protein